MCKEVLFLFFLIIFCFGCDAIEPSIESDTDIVTIDHNKVGFSFSHGKVITLPNTEKITPDLVILAHIAENGNVLGVFLSAVNVSPTFNLVREFSQTDSALTFFNNLNEVPALNYQNFALPINVNQVWAVKTSENKYGKILILDAEAYYDSVKLNHFTLAKFKWEYQPNGSMNF
jgi:hypothetical protein